MDKQVNQQQTLFRFVSIRPPQLIDNTIRKQSFIDHPGSAGVFYAAVTGRPPEFTKWEAMEKETETFSPLTVEAIKAISPTNAEVSEWISRNWVDAPAAELVAKIDPLTEISNGDIITLWDNLFYQVITQKDFYAKELISQLLILQNTIQVLKVTTPGERVDYVKKLADARTVLPTELFTEEEAEYTDPDDEGEKVFSTRELDKSMDVAFSRYAIARNETAVTELRKLQAKFQQKFQEDYIRANDEYSREVKIAYEAATVTEREGVECPSGCKYFYYDYEGLNLPRFEFTPPQEIDPSELKTKLAPESYYVVKSLGLLEEKTYDAIVKEIEKSSEGLNKKVFSNLPLRQVVAFGGMIFMDESSEKSSNPFLNQNQFPFVASFKATSDAPKKGKIFMAIDLGYNGAEATSVSYRVNFGSGFTDGAGAATSASGNILNLTLYPDNDGIAVPGAATQFTLEADVTLKDATTVHITREVTLTAPVKGVAEATNTFITPEKNVAFQPKDFGIKRLGIADYRKVVSEVCCYKEAEVSHIENIMAREFKSKTTTRERIEETTLTTETQYEKENLTDSTTTERLEMQSEVAKIIQQQKELGAYGIVRGQYTKATFETGANYATNTAKEESNRQAVTESREITEHAAERITTRFREELVKKITERFREDNSHIFDNRDGDHHVSGVYRYINAVYKNQIYNYGKRLIYEFMVPDPSRVHRYGNVQGVDNNTNGQIAPPPFPYHPSVFGLIDATYVSGGNYREFAGKYDASPDAPPLYYATIGKAYQGKGVQLSYSKEYNDLKIPEGYQAYAIHYVYSHRKADGIVGSNLNVQLQLGNMSIPIPIQTNNSSGGTPLTTSGMLYLNNAYSMDTIPVSIIGWDLGAYALNVTVYLQATADLYENWQVKTFNTIVAAYKERLDEYNRYAEQIQTETEVTMERNPLFYRDIEQITLKRNCISYLLNSGQFGINYTTGTDFQNYSVTRSQQMDNYASLSKFMEQAFEWNIMSYNFYPYYWANKANWTQLYQSENNDKTFRDFMQSGMARVHVTVRPGFEEAVMYFMIHKKIWNGGKVPSLGDPLFVSIVQELKNPEYVVEETWETTLPTSLIGLQKSGVAVDTEGLPCGGGCETGTSPFKPNSNNLGPVVEPAE